MLKIEVTGTEAAAARLRELAARGRDLSPVLKAFGQYKERQVKLGFVEQRDPYGKVWKALKASTLERKRRLRKSPDILRENGDLRASISYEVTARSVIVGSTEDSPKPTVHQFGTSRAGRGRKTTIPARPWLAFTRGDEIELVDTIRAYFDS